VGELLAHITTPRLHAQYAKAREADGSYKEAVAAYEAANDHLSVIRLNLDHLRNPDEAVRIVKQTGSVEGAKLVANFFQKLGDASSAIQFLVMSQATDEAYAMAQKHDQLDIYAQVLGETGDADDYKRIAKDFEAKGNLLEAGRYLSRAGDYVGAVNLLLKAGSGTADNTNIELAIEAAGHANDEGLTRKVEAHLQGKTDGVPKDANLIFQFYVAMRRFREAASTAVNIAQEEQSAGSYRTAHDVLFGMYRQLQGEGIRVPLNMNEDLNILHSYILGKIHLKRNDHLKAARMLIRVAKNISKFPAHVVNILTSTVIECFRSGLKNSAFSFATELLKPGNREKLDAKYKKKIETIVRKKDTAEQDEDQDECPFCQTALPVTALQCYNCSNRLPMCIASGFFVNRADFCQCPHCQFPARREELVALLETEDKCMMCYEPINSSALEVRFEELGGVECMWIACGSG
jgi:WD repeat-containing protein 19